MGLTLSLNLQKVGAGETAIDAAGTKNYNEALLHGLHATEYARADSIRA
ncbi:MAG: hypothetical protein PHD68_06905 [Rugosibacter sp.]|jgi:hypothetical protein|nr:hypothetical protein [Rugosibacter sp.]HPB90231.1 hypothetical protein [Rugosibacter sp.]HQN46432.1 hypothetical protein [Rugosibacter sp.]